MVKLLASFSYIDVLSGLLQPHTNYDAVIPSRHEKSYLEIPSVQPLFKPLSTSLRSHRAIYGDEKIRGYQARPHQARPGQLPPANLAPGRSNKVESKVTYFLHIQAENQTKNTAVCVCAVKPYQGDENKVYTSDCMIHRTELMRWPSSINVTGGNQTTWHGSRAILVRPVGTCQAVDAILRRNLGFPFSY